jgi:hypothetical protein
MTTEQTPGIGVPWIMAIAVIASAFLLGRCTAPPAAAQETQSAQASDAVVVLGNDGTVEAQAAIAGLGAFLDSVTPTTTTLSVQHSAAAPATVPAAPTSSGDRWDTLAECESGGRWDHPPVAGGFSGGLMFHSATWRAMGGEEFAPDAYQASREEQIIVAERTRDAAGGSMSPWPGCSKRFGWL